MTEVPTTPATPEAPAAPAPPASPLYNAAPETPAPETPATPAVPEVPAEATPPATPEAAPAALDLKLPDGFTVDEPTLTALKETLVDPGLSHQERGQKLMDMYVKQVEAIDAANTKAYSDTQEAWQKELQNDPVYGGDKLAGNLENAAKAFEVYGSTEAKEAFDVTGAGNNPHIVRMIFKMAAALNEGTHVAPRGPAAQNGKGRSVAEVLYGSNPN